MDRYEKYARVYPAIVAMVIPGIFMVLVFWDVLPFVKDAEGYLLKMLEGIIVPVLLFSAIGYFLRNLFRWTSKVIFQIPLFRDDEAYMPTTNYLFWNNDFFTADKKKNIYSKILNKYQINIKEGKVKKKDELAVRKNIAQAVRLIRLDYRKTENNDPIVLDYNIQYGMFRNFLGGSIYSCLLIVATTILNVIYSFTDRWTPLIILIIVQVLLIVASIIFQRKAASDYAKYLIDYFDLKM